MPAIAFVQPTRPRCEQGSRAKGRKVSVAHPFCLSGKGGDFASVAMPAAELSGERPAGKTPAFAPQRKLRLRAK